VGIAIALPIGVAIAVWLTEYGKPSGLARAVESGVEIVAGTPSIVLAIFGLLIFQQGAFGFLSFTAAGGEVFGRSFFAAGAMMSLIALPLVVGATRESLQAIPSHVRGGLLRARQGPHLDDPARSPARRTARDRDRGDTGHGTDRRRHGDRRDPARRLPAADPEGHTPLLGTLKGTGSTLTSYVYNNSPAGEGNAPEKAYAAAFVLLLIVIILNFAVDLIARRKEPVWSR
jgi:phosphate transport system permease protein